MPAGIRRNPTYEEVCSGRTRAQRGGAFAVYDPKKISYEKLLKTFWEDHEPDPRAWRQGNDVGTQ